MATKRRKVKVAKAMPIQTAARTEKRLLHLRAPGGVHTYRDVQRALKSIARFAGGNPRHNKMLAYTVLEYFGVHRLADLPLDKFDEAVKYAAGVRMKMVADAAIARSLKTAELTMYEKRVQRLSADALDLHFRLRALGSYLDCDPALAALAAQVKAKESLAIFESFDAALHEHGRAHAVWMLTGAKTSFDALDGNADFFPAATCKLMRRRLAAAAELLASKNYGFKKRYAAAAEIRTAIEIWTTALAAVV